MTLRILICGDRHFRDARRIFRYLSMLDKSTVIIEGEARGADTIVWVCCEILGLKYHRFPADWAAYHKTAGFKRNTQMLEEGKPHLVLFYHDNLDESRGTIQMITMADKAGIPVDEGPKYFDVGPPIIDWDTESHKITIILKDIKDKLDHND